MNVERMRVVANAIRATPKLYDQSAFGDLTIKFPPSANPKTFDWRRHACGSAGCVAGFTLAIYQPGYRVPDNDDPAAPWIAEAARTLELSHEETLHIFEAHWPREWREYCNAEQEPRGFAPSHLETANILDAFADLGRVPTGRMA